MASCHVGVSGQTGHTYQTLLPASRQVWVGGSWGIDHMDVRIARRRFEIRAALVSACGVAAAADLLGCLRENLFFFLFFFLFEFEHCYFLQANSFSTKLKATLVSLTCLPSQARIF